MARSIRRPDGRITVLLALGRRERPSARAPFLNKIRKIEMVESIVFFPETISIVAIGLTPTSLHLRRVADPFVAEPSLTRTVKYWGKPLRSGSPDARAAESFPDHRRPTMSGLMIELDLLTLCWTNLRHTQE